TISHWLPGTTSPDEYLQIANNVPAALAAIGVTKIDLLLWWQGEAQTPATCEMRQYPADWEAVFGRLLLESWFPRATPVVVFGIAAATISGLMSSDIQNSNLQAVVRADPDCRRFVYSGSLAASYWLDTAHLTGAGYDQLGKMAAAEFVY